MAVSEMTILVNSVPPNTNVDPSASESFASASNKCDDRHGHPDNSGYYAEQLAKRRKTETEHPRHCKGLLAATVPTSAASEEELLPRDVTELRPAASSAASLPSEDPGSQHLRDGEAGAAISRSQFQSQGRPGVSAPSPEATIATTTAARPPLPAASFPLGHSLAAAWLSLRNPPMSMAMAASAPSGPFLARAGLGPCSGWSAMPPPPPPPSAGLWGAAPQQGRPTGSWQAPAALAQGPLRAFPLPPPLAPATPAPILPPPAAAWPPPGWATGPGAGWSGPASAAAAATAALAAALGWPRLGTGAGPSAGPGSAPGLLPPGCPPAGGFSPLRPAAVRPPPPPPFGWAAGPGPPPTAFPPGWGRGAP